MLDQERPDRLGNDRDLIKEVKNNAMGRLYRTLVDGFQDE
jgi:hypothetical protein